jgi:hypothetical protein
MYLHVATSSWSDEELPLKTHARLSQHRRPNSTRNQFFPILTNTLPLQRTSLRPHPPHFLLHLPIRSLLFSFTFHYPWSSFNSFPHLLLHHRCHSSQDLRNLRSNLGGKALALLDLPLKMLYQTAQRCEALFFVHGLRADEDLWEMEEGREMVLEIDGLRERRAVWWAEGALERVCGESERRDM